MHLTVLLRLLLLEDHECDLRLVCRSIVRVRHRRKKLVT